MDRVYRENGYLDGVREVEGYGLADEEDKEEYSIEGRIEADPGRLLAGKHQVR